MLTLPAYSPELNPMENVWDYLRQNKLCSRVWNTYEDIVEACKQAWHFLIDDPDRIRSLGQRSWACAAILTSDFRRFGSVSRWVEGGTMKASGQGGRIAAAAMDCSK